VETAVPVLHGVVRDGDGVGHIPRRGSRYCHGGNCFGTTITLDERYVQ
jgi:hypothetical protein